MPQSFVRLGPPVAPSRFDDDIGQHADGLRWLGVSGSGNDGTRKGKYEDIHSYVGPVADNTCDVSLVVIDLNRRTGRAPTSVCCAQDFNRDVVGVWTFHRQGRGG
jgi:hypothetical protein